MEIDELNKYINDFNYKQFKKLQKLIVKDLNNNLNKSSVILKTYSREDLIKYLKDPSKNQKKLREMSAFLYNTSPNYKRLIDYLSLLSTDNYYISPADLVITNEQEFKDSYYDICLRYDRYSFKSIMPTIRQIALLNGIYCGICYESKDGFCLKSLNLEYCRISSMEDGNWVFSFDMDYFSNNKELLPEYGKNFEKAYKAYKGDPETNTPGDNNQRWYEPPDQICVKLDNSQAEISTPYFIGLFSAILEIDLYKEIKKDKAILDNYKVLTLQIATDDNGMPKLTYEQATPWYNQAVSNIPDGVGAIMTPFKMDALSLGDNKTQDGDIAEDAQKMFWENAGVSALLFGIGDKPTSQSLELSVKPDESLVFSMNESIAKCFNTRFKKSKHSYTFVLNFLEQSRFNKNQVIDSLLKAASYGLPVKSKLMAAYGVSPLKALSMSYLEDSVLKFTIDILNKPLLQSSTMSPDKETGRPTNESKGLSTSDSTEVNREANTENR